MVVRHLRPGPPLHHFVDRFWYFDRHSAPHARERALPTGTVELVINLGEDRIRVFGSDSDLQGQQFHGSIICGAQPSYFVIEPSPQQSIIGVHFRPGGAAPFLGTPAAGLTGIHLGLDDVWGSAAANDLRTRLIEAASPGAMFLLLERALLARLTPSLLPHPAASFALRQLTLAPAVSRIGTLQSETGYSPKHFIQLFRNSVGLTPKVYCRIRRFQKVIAQIAGLGQVDWAAVALDGGYYDQSHLNREFQAFAGVSPAAYRPVAPDRPSHVAIADAGSLERRKNSSNTPRLA